MFADSRLLLGSDAARLGSPLPESEASSLLDHERFEVRFVLGEGAFGTVYRGWDRHLQREVAIKIPKPRQGQRRDQFLQEARAAAGLRHPGLVTVHDAGADRAGRLFAVHELIAGSPLSELAASGRLDLPHAVRLVAEAAEAVHHAHREGFVHRDLKPSNILVDSDGRARVSDFGLALSEQELRDRAGEISGSPAYMSPEQVRGDVHRLDGRTDIWSLGVILYELLTGRRPFSGRTQDEYFDEIQNREPKPIRQINDAIPRPLEHAAMKCLSKPVRERYSTAADLAADLRGWLQEISAAGTPAPLHAALPLASLHAAPTALAADPQVTTSRDKASFGGPSLTLRRENLPWLAALAVVFLVAVLGTWAVKSWFPPRAAPPADPAAANPPAANAPANVASDAAPRPPANAQPAASGVGERKRPAAVRGGWRPLLAQDPKTFLSPPGVKSFVSFFNPEAQELHATSNQFFMLNLGEIDADDFEFTISLTQTPWTGGIGIFFGADPAALVETTVDERPAHLCQAIEVVRADGVVGKISLGRSALTLIGQRQLKMRETLEIVPIALRSGEEAELRVEVRRGLVAAIGLNEKSFPSLVGGDVDEELAQRNVAGTGKIGIILSDGTGVFQRAAWRSNKEK